MAVCGVKRNTIVWSANYYKSLIEMSRKPLKSKRKVDASQTSLASIISDLFVFVWYTYQFLFPYPRSLSCFTWTLKMFHYSSLKYKPYPTTYIKPHKCLNGNFPGKKGRGIQYKFNRYRHKTALKSGTCSSP